MERSFLKPREEVIGTLFGKLSMFNFLAYH
jgi:hypothetical protein